MADLLVRLYDLPAFASEQKVAAQGIVVRRALPPERGHILDWIGPRFSPYWVSEAAGCMSRLPPSLFVAIDGQRLLGFACYDGTAKGFFGPTGVDEAARGRGIGETLLIVTLRAMREAGYGYAVIGDPGPVEFYRKRLDVLEIPKSDPGIYAGMLPSKLGPSG
ncbi:MAG TPA: GNAT family N-acetyltransferase [Devosia sp.]|nr:GNAT family N-acetyltransferase [Devosia sp.]